MAEEQPPEVKSEAREFMKGLVGSPQIDFEFVGGDGMDMAAWKVMYLAEDKVMDKFWSVYNPKSSSIWTMKYDEADSNETLSDTVELVKDFIKKCDSLQSHCFGVIHILDGLEIEGLWVINGPDPSELFGTNEDTSWYSWEQMGPEANDLVKKAVAAYMVPTEGKLKGKDIKDTQAFC